MTDIRKILLIQPDAAPKPAAGAPCNGCGVCCLAAPCPLGMVLSGRRRGSCSALVWNREHLRYQCGAITQPETVLTRAMPKLLRVAAPSLAPLVARLAWRWIAAGSGCDSALEAEMGQPLTP